MALSLFITTTALAQEVDTAEPDKIDAEVAKVATAQKKVDDGEITFTVDELEADPLYGTLSAGLAGSQRPEEDPERPGRYVLRPPKSELSFVGVYFSRATATNIAVLDPLRTGLVTGRLFGSNASSTTDSTGYYVEQRMLGFFTYSPRLLNERARLRAAFEVDFIYGDAANGAGANVGGGINGDQVNLQTKRLAVEIGLFPGWYAVAGLQALTDNVHDPEKTDPNVMLHTGYHLGFWGTDASGLAVYGQVGNFLKIKAAGYALWENVPHEDDDIWLLQSELALRPSQNWWIGASAWFLSDEGQGSSGFGFRSPVATANGAATLRQEDVRFDYEADIVWLGLNINRNAWFKTDRLVLDGFAMWNIGTIDKMDPDTGELLLSTDINGFAALAEGVVRYGRTRNDTISLEGIYTTGDFDLDDQKYGSVVTGQMFGVPGAIFGSHRSLLLMPDLRVVNRQFAAISDLSNGGYGVFAGFVNGQYDLIANKLTAKIGSGAAWSAVDVPSTGARFIGTEVNGELYFALDSLLILGVHGGYLFLGDFFSSAETVLPLEDGVDVVQPDDPWMVYSSLTWVAF